MASKRQYILELLLGAKTDSSYDSNIKKASKSLTGISSAAKKVSNSAKKAGNSFTGISSAAKKAAGLITAAFATVNITGAMKDAVEEYAEFEQELTNTAATAGATQVEYEQMQKAAREAGMATTKTASESAAALGYMALAGWDVNESTEALMPVLRLSEATHLDLARTSDLVTDSMSALKLEVSDLPEYLDLVTKGQNSSNQTAEEMMEAYIRAGGAARALGIDVKDAGIALGMLADNGVKASEGGRTINAILTRMSANGTAIGQLKALNVSIFDAKGNFVGFEEALKRINKGLNGLTTEKQTQALKDIAGTQYFSKMRYLLDSVKEGAKGTDSAWSNLDKKLSDSEGTLDKMSSQMTNTMSGSVEIMKSAISDAKISFGDAFNEEIVEVIHDITGMFNNISEGITGFSEENKLKMHLMFEGVKEDITGAGEFIGNFASGVVENFDMVESAVAGVASVSLASKAIKQFKTIGNVLDNFALSSISKGGLITGGITLVTGAVAAVGVHAYNTHKKLVQADLDGRFGNITLSLEDIDKVSQQIVGKKKLVKISEMLEAIGKTDDGIEEMTANMKNISRLSWKVKAGLKLDTEDTQNYKTYIENYVKSAQDVLDNQGYSVSVATNILFGNNSKISKKNDAFYAGLDAELEGLEKKLNKKISKAVENGVDIDTDKSIQKLLGEVNTITAAITDAQEEASWQELSAKYSGKDLDADTFKQLSADVKKYVQEANEGADEAYNTELTNINAQKNIKLLNLQEKLDNKQITKKQYNKSVAKTESRHEADVQKTTEAYYSSKAKTMAKSSEYLMKTITDAYPEAEKAIEQFNELVQEGIDTGGPTAMPVQIAHDALNDLDLDLSSVQQDALKSLFDSGLNDIQAQMQQYATELENASMPIPKSIAKNLNSMDALAVISDSADGAVSYVRDRMVENEQWAKINSDCNEKGAAPTKEIASGIEKNTVLVTNAVSNLLDTLQNNFNNRTVTANIGLNLNLLGHVSTNIGTGSTSTGVAPAKGTPAKSQTVSPPKKQSGGKLAKNAKGGIYSSPIATILAEDGDSEAVIPLNSSSRAKALWKNAGKMLGMTPVEDNTLYNTTNDTSSVSNHNKNIYQAFETEYNNDNSAINSKKIYEHFMAVKSNANPSGSLPNSSVNITYAPQITIQGNADKTVVENALSTSKAKLTKMLDEYFYGKKRVAMRE